MTETAKRTRRKPERLTKSRVNQYLRAGIPGNYPDTQSGLSLRIRDVGKGSWFYSYSTGGKQRRMALLTAGVDDEAGLAEAREIASTHARNNAQRKTEIQAAIEAGTTPPPPYDPINTKWMGDNAPVDLTLREALDRYAQEAIGEMPPGLDPAQQTRWQRNAQSRTYLLNLIPTREWLSLPLAQVPNITRRMLRDRQDQLRSDGVGPASVNRGTSYLNTALNWVLQENIGLNTNPFAGFSVQKQHREQSRSVVPTSDEVKALWKATEGDELPLDYRRVWRMCMLTGARRSEIASLRRDDAVTDATTEHGQLSGHAIIIEGAKTEAGNRPIPLCAMAGEIVTEAMKDAAGEYLFGVSSGGVRPFGNWSRAIKRHRALAGIDRDITIHDLRRLAFTRLSAAGVDLMVIQTLIGHRRGSATMQTYNRAKYWPEMREAVDRLQADLVRDLG